jgi:2'-5' RNA ligase
VRLFIAINLPQETRGAIETQMDSLRPALEGAGKLRWTPPGQLHFTLKFLGACAESHPEKLKAVLRRTLQFMRPFEIEIGGLGAFPSPAKPRIFWMGVKAGLEGLERAATELESGCADLGFPREERRFHAHLTLARIPFLRDAKPLRDVIESAREKSYGRFTAKSICLMESRLLPQGPEYAVLEEIPFLI